MRRGSPCRSEQNQSLDEEIGKIPGSYKSFSMVKVMMLLSLDDPI
jgi:hypothetical protein